MRRGFLRHLTSADVSLRKIDRVLKSVASLWRALQHFCLIKVHFEGERILISGRDVFAAAVVITSNRADV